MSVITSLIGLAGGLGLFIYGTQLCSEGLQKMAAQRIKGIIKFLTINPLLGLMVGALVTFALQSSSGASALVIGFVSAGLMSLTQALMVLLGSAVGASLTAQLIAFQITSVALVLLFLGANLYLFGRRLRTKSLGQALFGFGLIFFGLSVMSAAMAPVRELPAVARIMAGMEQYPGLEFLVALVVTAVFQSSTAFLALMMSLAENGLIGPYAILPMILGTHLGGTVTGVISSLGTPGEDAKRAAFANFGFKLFNGLIFLPFYRPLTHLVLWSSSSLSREIANAHTLFSVIMALGFLPFTKTKCLEDFLVRIFPARRANLGEAKFLDESLLNVPELAVDQAHRQALEMGRIIREEMVNQAFSALSHGNQQLIERIVQTEPAIDSLYKQISKYVTSLGNNRLPNELMQKSIQVLYMANDLEHIGDLLVNFAQTAGKIRYENLQFSEEGFEELEVMFNRIQSNFNKALKAFETSDQALATQIVKGYPKTLRLEKELRYSHFERMQGGNEKTMASSAAHLDLIESMLRMENHSVNIAQGVLGIV